MSDKYDEVANKLLRAAAILRESSPQPQAPESSDCAQDMRLMDGAMLAQAEELSVKALQDAIWIIDKISSGKEATKAIDLIKRVKDAIETGELKIEPPCQIKHAPVPSAEAEACEIICGVAFAKGCGNKHHCNASKAFAERLEVDRAAQRQAGREEALDIYNDALVVMDRRHAELITCYARLEEAAKCVQREKAECSEVSTQAWDAIDEALDELGKARRG